MLGHVFHHLNNIRQAHDGWAAMAHMNHSDVLWRTTCAALTLCRDQMETSCTNEFIVMYATGCLFKIVVHFHKPKSLALSFQKVYIYWASYFVSKEATWVLFVSKVWGTTDRWRTILKRGGGGRLGFGMLQPLACCTTPTVEASQGFKERYAILGGMTVTSCSNKCSRPWGLLHDCESVITEIVSLCYSICRVVWEIAQCL